MYFSPGVGLKISAYVYHDKSNPKTAELTALPMEKLKQLEQASITVEKTVIERIEELIEQWHKQAGETVTIRKAMEYLKMGPVEHTANQWIAKDSGIHEISNMVYKMTWRVYERIRWNRATQRSEVEAWELSWYVTFNTVQNPDNTRTGRQIAGQSGKVFKDKGNMDKYLQGRITAHAHLFTEISPPIPKGEEGRFSVNGVLLPSYSKEVTIDDLLECLDENDTVEMPSLPPTSRKSPAHKHKKHTLTR